MAAVVLDRIWVNRLDSGEAVSAQTGRGRSRQHSMEGEVRTYAGGRQRAYTTAGERGTFGFTLRSLSLAQVDVLRSWIGLPVQVRDHRGQRLIGVFFEVRVTERRPAALYDVDLTVQAVTVTEGV